MRRHLLPPLACAVVLLTTLGLGMPPERALAAAAASAPPQLTATAPSPADLKARQQRIFRRLWRIVNDRYIYPDFNGYDWRAARNTMNQRIAAGMSDDQFYEAMRQLIIALGDDHSQFLSPDEARSEDADYEGTGSYIGIGIVTAVNRDKGYLYVLSVLPDSPAEQSGIRPHDHVLEIDGQPSVDAQGNSQAQLLRGPPGTVVRLRIRTPGMEPRLLELQREAVSSVERIEYRVLAHDAGGRRIGYLNIPSLFEESVLARSRQALRALMQAGPLDGLILDLRTNGGGTYGNLRGLLTLFTDGEVGYFATRSGMRTPIRVRANNIGNSQRVPLAVLVGPATESFAEVLAGVLQSRGRAALIGQHTAGNIETLLSHEFEDGSRLWLAEESFRLPDGSGWEGRGLEPDVYVDKNWDEYTLDDDPVLAAALEHLGAAHRSPG